MRLTLRNDGFPYYKVMRGHKWIGRVYKAADGMWACDIHRTRYYTGATTPQRAFEEGGSRYMGAASAADLDARNRAARRRSAEARAEGRAIAADMLSRDPATQRAAFDRFFVALSKGGE